MEFELIVKEKRIKIKEGALLSFKTGDKSNYIVIDMQKKPLLSRIGKYSFRLFHIEKDSPIGSRFNQNDMINWLNDNGELTSIV